eukprot:438025-Amphidinium_carterae.1
MGQQQGDKADTSRFGQGATRQDRGLDNMKEEISMDVEPIHIPPPPGLDNPIPHPEEAIPVQDQPIPGGDEIVDMEVDKPTEDTSTHRKTIAAKASSSNRRTIGQHRRHEGSEGAYIGEQRGQRRKQLMELIMSDVHVQPWFQYEDDITMFSEHAVKDAMKKELSQLINKWTEDH